jgi:SRSO17 transposase
LQKFLSEFADCFARSEPRKHLCTYVQGPLSDLPRKSIEPRALAAGVTPRTVQNFVSQLRWDEPRLRDRTPWIVARDHAHPRAIGIVDESGNPKKGQHPAGVQRQGCGNTGKRDNGGVGVPEEVVFRTKPALALAQIGHAIRNGIRGAAWTFDEFYGRGQEFLDGRRELGQNFVGEIPCEATGWRQEPQVLQPPGPRRRPPGGPARRYPRLARKNLPAREVRHLVVYSPVFRRQRWQKFRIKDGEKGPVVWEVKHAPFYRKQGRAGLPGPADTLIVARNVLDPQEIKYFRSHLVVDGPTVPLEGRRWVGFCRSPIERCFEIAKSELGMDHFEMRSWRGLHRHGYLTQVSPLFWARVPQQPREKKHSRRPLLDPRTSPPGGLCVGASPGVSAVRPNRRVRTGGRADPVLSATEPTGSSLALENDPAKAQNSGDQYPQIEVLYTG